MSKHLEQILIKELQVLNESIDEKIIRGMPYAKEARRHKFLYARLINTRKNAKQSLFRRLSFTPTFFL